MDPVSHPADASVQLDGPVVPVSKVPQTCLQYFWFECVCTIHFLHTPFLHLGFCLSPCCAYLGLFAIHGIKLCQFNLGGY